MKAVEYQWIDTDAEVAAVCAHLSTQAAIAVDTEFVRTRTYYPQLGLLQIADSEQVYLIDPLPLNNTQPIADLLVNPTVTKVLHACSEDLEVFQHAFNVLPVNLFDTQIAAGFASYGSSIGYANLLREVTGIDIPKQETRSDWLQRPLSPAQLSYAALDVEYLLPLHQTLVKQLGELGRLSWVEEDCLAIIAKLKNTDNAKDYYLRIKSAWKLQSDQLAVLQALSTWREEQARTYDVPRSRVLKDTALYDMAFKLPLELRQLKAIKDIPYRITADYADEIFALINQTLDDQADYPERLPAPFNRKQADVLKALKQQVSSIADTLDMPQELLARKKDYEVLLRDFLAGATLTAERLPTSLQGWRQSIVGNTLINYLNNIEVEEDYV